jgi:hypothetical protein
MLLAVGLGNRPLALGPLPLFRSAPTLDPVLRSGSIRESRFPIL